MKSKYIHLLKRNDRSGLFTKFLIYQLTILGAIIFLQTIHFNLYYLQPLGKAFVWSLVDWCTWFLMFYFAIIYMQLENNSAKKLSYINALIIIGSFTFIHIIISTLIYKGIYGLSRPFVDDVIHMLYKRWYQNIFIASSLLILFVYLKRKFLSDSNSEDVLNKKTDLRLIVDDGKTTYYLSNEEIYWLEAAKNYVVVQIKEKQILVRGTLKSLEDRLSKDNFLRISRSVIINFQDISSIKKETKNSIFIITHSGEKFKVGKTYQKEISEIKRSHILHPI